MAPVPRDDDQPDVSFVVAVRNDNYGGDFNARLQLSVQRLAHLVRKHGLLSELLLVDYNPIADRPPFADLIEWPEPQWRLSIRMITVPGAMHEQRFVRPLVRKTVALFEFIAKNIGIRRARGRFILCTNADVLFSDGLIALFARGALRTGVLYRTDRYDFQLKRSDRPSAGVTSDDFEQLLHRRVFRFFVQGGTFTLRWPSSLEARLAILRRYNAFRHRYYRALLHTPGERFFLGLPKITARQYFLFKLHCNASGDMTLMDRESWLKVRGYLEDTWIATHTDSLLLTTAHAAGIPVKVLPHPVFHQHHQRRFDFGVPDPDMDRMYRRLLEEGNLMLQSKQPIMNTDPNWGLGDVTLEEHRP